jgi:hypothetical protein
MPISLAAGTVRTPEFAVKRKYYNILVVAKWLIPPDELKCRMGLKGTPVDAPCRWEPLLETRWRVLDGDRIVAEGVDEGVTPVGDADNDSLSRRIAYFKGEARRKYVVELSFIKDAGVLNVTQPRLIVETPEFSF